MSIPNDSSAAAAATAAHTAIQAARKATSAAGEIFLLPSPTPRQGKENYDFAGEFSLPDYTTQICHKRCSAALTLLSPPAVLINRLLAQFHWTLSKLPSTLIDTNGALCDDQTAVADSYMELQNILLRSYRLSATQKDARLLDHPGLGSNNLFVLMDQLNTLKPDSLDDIMQVLFFRKMPGCIQDVLNPRDYKTLADLTQGCNKIWENSNPDTGAMAAAAAAAVLQSHSPACGYRHSSSPFHGKRPTNTKSTHHRSPTPGPARGSRDGSGCGFYHTCFGAAAWKYNTSCIY
jgi:hypothetical protein